MGVLNMIDLKKLEMEAKTFGLYFNEIPCKETEVVTKTKIKMFDKNGYFYSISAENISNFKKRKGSPAIFFNKNPYSFQNINKYFELNNIELELLTPNPKNAVEKLEFRCKKHDEVFRRCWNSVKNGRVTCPKCEGSVVLYTIETAKQRILEERGCKLISTEWKGNSAYYDFECLCGNLFRRRYDVVLYQGSSVCRKCSGTQGKFSQKEVEDELIKYGINLLSVYQSSEKKIRVKYPCGEVVERSLANIKHSNYKCPHCVNKTYNMNEEKFKRKIFELTQGEYEFLGEYQKYNTKMQVLHRGCGHVFTTTPNRFIRGNARCPLCSDGVSYPEKYIGHMLKGLNVTFETQYRPTWSQRKRYDFYLPDYNMIIETHGIQHYQTQTKRPIKWKSYEEEHENDLLKFDLSVINGVEHYVVLDCRKSELEWIQDEVKKSLLDSKFDLSTVNFRECHRYALNSLVLEAETLHKKGESVDSIATILGLSTDTIKKYLKQVSHFTEGGIKAVETKGLGDL